MIIDRLIMIGCWKVTC